MNGPIMQMLNNLVWNDLTNGYGENAPSRVHCTGFKGCWDYPNYAISVFSHFVAFTINKLCKYLKPIIKFTSEASPMKS